MSKLESVSVAGFRSIRQQKVDLAPINVIVGPNGSGKSNFLGVFSLLAALRRSRLQHYIQKAGGANQILHFGAEQTDAVELEWCFRNDDVQNRYRIRLEVNALDQLAPAGEEISIWNQEQYETPASMALAPNKLEAGISIAQDVRFPDVLKYIQGRLDMYQTYHFPYAGFNSPMLRNAEMRLSYPLLPSGENLAPFLYSLREHHKDRYELIRRTLRMVTPFFDDFVLEPLQENSDFIRLQWTHLGHVGTFDVSAMSDGTVRFAALATLFLQPHHYLPPVILIDEPELGLHPAAMTILAAMMRSASLHSQIIVATQSAGFLDHFQPNDVLVAEREAGSTTFTRLKNEDLADELKHSRLGELWEFNEFGGRPRSE